VLFLIFALSVRAQENETYIAFVSKREVNEDIFVTSLDGSQVFNLTQSRSRNWHPSWSPDGTRIAYNSDQDGNAEIYVMNANGTNKINVSRNPAGDTSPDWSPAANEIAFISDRDGGYDLYVLDIDNGTTRRLTTDGAPKSDPDWSPDGLQIAFWQQISQTTVILKRINVESGEVITIIDEGQNLWPAWSPRGDTIAFFSAASGAADIFTVSLADSHITSLTSDPASDLRPDWSPSGAQIVFMSNRDGDFNLYIMNADGSGARRLTDAPQDDHSPAWQPVPARIDYDPAALGQNVNIVQGNVSPDAQGELGAGQRRLYAPETIYVEDIIRVRLEIDVAALDATPAPAPDIPLRDARAMTVYRYMGAELTGLDLGRFDVFPNPSGYVLQIREDGVNYWEWMLRPKQPDALGRNFLAVRIYLPEMRDDGAIVRTELEVIPFAVEVVSEEPEVQSEYALDSMEPEVKQGISVYYSDQNALSIAFTSEADVSDMRIATEGVEFPVLEDFPSFRENGNQVPANTCIYYEQEGEEPVLPRACRSAKNFSYPLIPGDIFWYDSNARQLRNVIIRKDEKVFICPAGANRCDF
jgi:Tol biopolymer transport system component